MTVRALFVIAVVVQLQFSVEGNCTTELSETDDADVTSSPGDDFQNESQEDNRNSTKREDTALGTDKRKRSNQDGSVVEVIMESNITHGAKNQTTTLASVTQDKSWGISKQEAKTAILEEVSSGSEYQYNDLGIINEDRFDRDTVVQVTSGGIIDFGEPATNEESSTIAQEDSSNSASDDRGSSPQDRISAESTDEETTVSSDDSDYEFNVDVEYRKRFNRNTNNQGAISDGSSVGVTGKSRNQSTVITITQANTSASEDDIDNTSQVVEAEGGGTGVPAIPSNVEPLPKLLYKRLKRQESETITTDSSLEVYDATSSTSTNDSASTPNKKKLRRFPSLQYIARNAILGANSGNLPIPSGMFREKRGTSRDAYSTNYEELKGDYLAESWKFVPYKNLQKRLIPKHFFKI